MDLLYTARLDAFCIVSSDSDFTRLAPASANPDSPSTASATARRPSPSSQPATSSSTPKTSAYDHPKAAAETTVVKRRTPTPADRRETTPPS
ncbi:hypothetical protein ACQEVC_10665 [Plantactinospora sp. CA-294935]|uniref:hypothetical protein n=1 Tax=Plantactinospora sp. CA-294935 TaxID=3240012 RepID=UPI003D8C1037